MEVWLRDEAHNKSFRFPIIPMPISVQAQSMLSTQQVMKLGNVSIYDGQDLGSAPLSGFFPKTYIKSVCNYDSFPSPWECVELIESWRKSGTVLRYIVTGTPINMTVRVANFDYSVENGTGNVHYSLKLTEFRPVNIPEAKTVEPLKKGKKIPNSNSSSANNGVKNKPRTDAVKKSNSSKKGSTGRVHTVKKGEYLYILAQKYYGNGAQYTKIKNSSENIKNYPKLKNSNYIYVGWKLVIP